jgi:hypothetical protein
MAEVIVTLSSVEKHFPFEMLSIGYESTDREILDALAPVLLEEEGFDIRHEQSDGSFTIKKVDESQNIYVFPKSTAGL